MKQRVLFVVILFLAVANILVWGVLGVTKAYANRVYPGIWVKTTPLAGLNKDQAVTQLETLNSQLAQEKVTLSLVDKEYNPTLADLGYSVDTEAIAADALEIGRGSTIQQIALALMDYQKDKSLPIQYKIDQDKFNSYLNDIGKEIAKEPKSISLVFKDGKIEVVSAEDGIVLNRDLLRETIQREVQPGKSVRIELSYDKSKPTLSDPSQVAAAKQTLDTLLAKSILLQAEEVNYTLTPDILFSFINFETKNNEMTIAINQDEVKKQVTLFAKKVDKKAIAKQVSEVNQSVISEGADGRQLNVPDTTKKILERVNAPQTEGPVSVAVTKIDRSTSTITPEYQTGRYPGRYLEVDLSAQRMTIMEGDAYVRTFVISTGSWSHPTPIGTFKILNHIQVAWSSRYKLYMPKWMAIQPDGGAYDGYGIHGLPYWPGGKKEGEAHLGKPVSHGCIRLGEEDINFLYEWAPNGTPVVIHQ